MMTVEDVERAQQAWGDGIVAIAAAHSSGLDYIATARNHIQSLYAYESVSYTHLTLPTKA